MKRVIALGFFDGVHLGHQALMKKTRERAAELGAVPSVISFDQHPDTLVRGEPVPLINSVAGRKELISRIGGIDDIIMIHFDERFMHTPWQEFLRIVKEELGAVHLVIGYDFCCGWRGEGTAERIARWCAENGLGCDAVGKVVLDGVTVSSTYIRSLVAGGEMEKADRYLGHPHVLIDTVGYGYRIGRQIGAPTINTRAAVTNIGVRPTFGEGTGLTVESNILDFSGDLYGAQIRLEFFAFLRDERRFESPEALREAIEKNIEQTRRYFRTHS